MTRPRDLTEGTRVRHLTWVSGRGPALGTIRIRVSDGTVWVKWDGFAEYDQITDGGIIRPEDVEIITDGRRQP